MTTLDQARRLVDAHLASALPEARAAMLTGSVVRGQATSTSDLDLVILLPDGHGTRRETVEWDGVAVDVFAYDPPGLDRWLAADTERRRPVLCTLILDGLLVAGDQDHADAAKAKGATSSPQAHDRSPRQNSRGCVTARRTLCSTARPRRTGRRRSSSRPRWCRRSAISPSPPPDGGPARASGWSAHRG